MTATIVYLNLALSKAKKPTHIELLIPNLGSFKQNIKTDLRDPRSKGVPITEANKSLSDFLEEKRKENPNFEFVFCVPYISFVHYCQRDFPCLEKIVKWMDLFTLYSSILYERKVLLKSPYEDTENFLKSAYKHFLPTAEAPPTSILTLMRDLTEAICQKKDAGSQMSDFVMKYCYPSSLSADSSYLQVFANLEYVEINGEFVISEMYFYVPDDDDNRICYGTTETTILV